MTSRPFSFVAASLRSPRRLAVAVAAAALLTAGPVALAADASSSDDTTYIVNGLASNTFAHLDMQAGAQTLNAFNIFGYDRLVAYGPGNRGGSVVDIYPYLAKSWVVKPKSVTFKVRTDVKCQDGSPMTPLVVLNSFKRLITVPKQTNFLIRYFGPGPYSLSADRFKGTFTFRTATPYRGLLDGFAHFGSGIVCPSGLKALESDPHALEKATYGSGPYKVDTFQPGVQLVFKRWSGWKWGPGGTSFTRDVKGGSKPMPETVIYRPNTDPTTNANQIIAGEINSIATGADRANLPRLLADKDLIHYRARGYTAWPIIYNMFPGHPTTDLNVRKALSYAFDCSAYNQAVFGGLRICTPSIWTPGTTCFNPEIAKKYAPGFSIAKARQALQSGGYTFNSEGLAVKGGKTLDITLLTTSVLFPGAGELLADWYKQAGFNVTLHNYSLSQWQVDLFGGKFDVMASAGDSDYLPNALYGGLPYFTGKTPTEGGSNFGNVGDHDPAVATAVRVMYQKVGKAACPYADTIARIYLEKAYAIGTAADVNDLFYRGWTQIPWYEQPEPWMLRKA
jgi:peptide/nickel transport system substrate-binding protein